MYGVADSYTVNNSSDNTQFIHHYKYFSINLKEFDKLIV